MKTTKAKFIIEQILIILLINYFLLVEEHFMERKHWLPSFVFAQIFFHLGVFASLYATIVSKHFTDEKYQLILNFNLFIYSSQLCLLFCHNCLVETNDLIWNYSFGMFMIANVTLFIFEIRSSYKKFKATLVSHN